MKAAPCF